MDTNGVNRDDEVPVEVEAGSGVTEGKKAVVGVGIGVAVLAWDTRVGILLFAEKKVL